MRDDATQSDGFADGMVAATALGAYPVVRGAARLVACGIDSVQRQALIARAEALGRHAAELVEVLQPRLHAIHERLGDIGIESRGSLLAAAIQIDDRAKWFSAANVRAFVETNKVSDLLLLSEMANFLVEPVRSAVSAIHAGLGSRGARDVRADLRKLELFLVRFAAEKFKADISRDNEPNYLVRNSLTRILLVGGALLAGLVAFFGMILLTV